MTNGDNPTSNIPVSNPAAEPAPQDATAESAAPEAAAVSPTHGACEPANVAQNEAKN
ncbi:MAG: hypothetical protein ACF788_10475 [Novipirellula sp. JB048]